MHFLVFSLRQRTHIRMQVCVRRGKRAPSWVRPVGDRLSCGRGPPPVREPFNTLDLWYKVECKPGEEGSATNSPSMLSVLPEVNLFLSMESSTLPLSPLKLITTSTQVRNIEEMEKAKLMRCLLHDRKQPNEEAHIVGVRCLPFSL